MVVEDGAAQPVPPMSGEEEIDFPPPVGRMRAIYTLHSEVAMFPRSFPGLSGASFKVAFEPTFMEKVRFLVELGFAGREPRVGGVSPRQMLLALVGAAQVPSGRRAATTATACGSTSPARSTAGAVRRRGEALIGPHREWGFGAGALDTGVPLAIAGQSCWQSARSRLRRPLPGDRAAASNASSPSSRSAASGSLSRSRANWTTEGRERGAIVAIASVNPANGKMLRSFAEASAAEIEAALALAERDFPRLAQPPLRRARREDAAGGGDPRRGQAALRRDR